MLEACVNFRLTPLHSDPGVEEQDVYFLPEELDAFYPPSLWTQSVNLSKEEAAKAKSESRYFEYACVFFYRLPSHLIVQLIKETLCPSINNKRARENNGLLSTLGRKSSVRNGDCS